MPMDFNYSSRKGDDVYHVLIGCPEAAHIKKKHHKFGAAPPDEDRRPCEVCQDEVSTWLRNVS